MGTAMKFIQSSTTPDVKTNMNAQDAYQEMCLAKLLICIPKEDK
jgi:hypothetical protein